MPSEEGQQGPHIMRFCGTSSARALLVLWWYFQVHQRKPVSNPSVLPLAGWRAIVNAGGPCAIIAHALPQVLSDMYIERNSIQEALMA